MAYLHFDKSQWLKKMESLPLGTTVWEESKLAKMACSGFFAPCFINNDYVTAEIICSTAHARHEVFAWSWTTLCYAHMWAPPRKGWHYCCIPAASIGSATRAEFIVRLLLRLLRQPGGRFCCVSLCHGCCQERINMSTVPITPWVFFQPLSSSLAYPGFSELCTRWNAVRQLALSTGSAIHTVKDLEIWFWGEIYVVFDSYILLEVNKLRKIELLIYSVNWQEGSGL